MGVLTDRRDGTTTVTLDWPQQRNALGVEEIGEVTEALTRATDGDTRVLVLTGNGAFCAGANLRSVSENTSKTAATHHWLIRNVAQRLIRTVIDAPVPVLAAVDGPAIGLGFDLAMACDCRLVGPDGWLMQGWGRIGVIPGTGGELLLRLRNPWLLWKLLAEQPRIHNADAERWGLGEAVIDGSALEAAWRRGEALSRFAPEALGAYVSMFRTLLRREAPEHLARCADIQSNLLTSPEVARRVTEALGR